MQIKLLFVLSLVCSFFSNPLSAYEYESSSFSGDYDPATAFSEPSNDPVFDDHDNNITSDEREFYESPHVVSGHPNYSARLPKKISAPGERLIVVNPRTHVWGAYTETGALIHAGLATAGAKWCSDIGRPCRTKTGVFRIHSMGDSDCISSIYPVGEGGAPMPYCMFFNGGQGLHGSDHLSEGNISHGCVRISVNDAEWLHYHFAHTGTKVIIQSY